jgi:hypothetical protein
MHYAITKDYIFNAIRKENILNKVNGDEVDMFKICLHTKLHMPTFNISLLSAVKPQKLKTFQASFGYIKFHKKITVIKVALVSKTYYDQLSHKL